MSKLAIMDEQEIVDADFHPAEEVNDIHAQIDAFMDEVGDQAIAERIAVRKSTISADGTQGTQVDVCTFANLGWLWGRGEVVVTNHTWAVLLKKHSKLQVLAQYLMRQANNKGEVIEFDVKQAALYFDWTVTRTMNFLILLAGFNVLTFRSPNDSQGKLRVNFTLNANPAV